MVHEMIHYYLAWNRVKTKKYHGKEFMEIANGLNEKYGLNITKNSGCSRSKELSRHLRRKGLAVVTMVNVVYAFSEGCLDDTEAPFLLDIIND